MACILVIISAVVSALPLFSKDPGPEGPALVHPVGVITLASRVQVSGVRCQQPNSTRCVGIAHEMDFLSSLWVFGCKQISAQVLEFGIY